MNGKHSVLTKQRSCLINKALVALKSLIRDDNLKRKKFILLCYILGVMMFEQIIFGNYLLCITMTINCAVSYYFGIYTYSLLKQSSCGIFIQYEFLEASSPSVLQWRCKESTHCGSLS